MQRILLVLFLLIASFLSGSELIRYSHEQTSLQERLKWAPTSASKENHFWIGYSVSRLMYPDEFFISGVSINGEFRLKKNEPSLHEWISGAKKEPKDIRETAELELQRLEHRKSAKVLKKKLQE